jgi:hypothetical protein
LVEAVETVVAQVCELKWTPSDDTTASLSRLLRFDAADADVATRLLQLLLLRPLLRQLMLLQLVRRLSEPVSVEAAAIVEAVDAAAAVAAVEVTRTDAAVLMLCRSVSG